MDEQPTTRDRWAIAFTLVFPSFITLLYFVLIAGKSTGLQQTIYWLGKTLQFAFPITWVLCAQRRSLQFRWPTLSGMLPAILFAVFVVAGMFALYLGMLKPQGFFDEPAKKIVAKVQNFGVGSFGTFVALGVFYALIHSFLEEYYWRWFVFAQLLEHGRPRPAILLSSAGFMAHHVIVLGYYFGWTSWLTGFFSVSVAVGGVVWAWLYHRAKSIYPPWLSHMIVDTGIFILGYDVIRGAL